jgi:hypothetical protein
MRSLAFAAALGALLSLAGCSTTPVGESLAAVPPPVVTGTPQACVQLQNIRESKVIDDRTIDFYMRNGKVLRNTLPNSCPQLGFERAFSYRTSITQLCSVDIITVIQQTAGIRAGASCGLGKFTPIELVKN